MHSDLVLAVSIATAAAIAATTTTVKDLDCFEVTSAIGFTVVTAVSTIAFAFIYRAPSFCELSTWHGQFYLV